MRQGRMIGALLAIAVLSLAVLLPAAGAQAKAATKSGGSSASASKSGRSLRQFTGYVTASDKQTLTVEKRGKKPQTRSFTKHAEMKTTGDLEKDAHVTVYYREDGGRAVAHRVVVKSEGEGSSGQR